jgi:hypothetical protein
VVDAPSRDAGRSQDPVWGGAFDDGRASAANTGFRRTRPGGNPGTDAPGAGPGAPRERGVPGWMALGVLLVIAGVGGLIDTLGGAGIKGGFNIALVLASAVGILIVRRSSMFPIVIAPPIVYAAASAGMLYLRMGGKHDRSVLIDAAANWLVYGFPAIAAATAVVLIVAAIRMVIKR